VVAAPRHLSGIVDDALVRRNVRAAADEVLMGREAAAALRLEQVIGQHPLIGNIPVRLDIRLLHVLVRDLAGKLRAVRAYSERGQIEPVHLAVIPVR